MSNQWKFDENFVEHDIFEIGGLIKSGTTYERLYTILKELAELKPELILCDFELAQSNAASAIFGCAIAYCYLYLRQNLFDKVEKLKLTKWYNTCEKFEVGIHSLKALTFFKPEHVSLGSGLGQWNDELDTSKKAKL